MAGDPRSVGIDVRVRYVVAVLIALKEASRTVMFDFYKGFSHGSRCGLECVGGSFGTDSKVGKASKDVRQVSLCFPVRLVWIHDIPTAHDELPDEILKFVTVFGGRVRHG